MPPPRITPIGGLFHEQRDFHDGRLRGLPTEERLQLLKYISGLLQRAHGIQLHGMTLMGTHLHTFYSDRGESLAQVRQRQQPAGESLPPSVEADLAKIIIPAAPSFRRDRNSWLAQSFNRLDDTHGKVMGDNPTSVQWVVDGRIAVAPLVGEPRDVGGGVRAALAVAVYMALNPAKARLPARDYVGNLGPLLAGCFEAEREVITRPSLLDKRHPEQVELIWTPPEVFQNEDPRELSLAFEHLFEEGLREIEDERRGKPSLSHKELLKLNPMHTLEEAMVRKHKRSTAAKVERRAANKRHRRATPKSANKKAAEKRAAKKRHGKRSQRIPRRDLTIKASCPVLRERATGWKLGFLSSYRSNLEKLQTRQGRVCFPSGTYKVALYCGANVARP